MRPAEGHLVRAADARAAATRAEAARWHYLSEAWHADGCAAALRGTPAPERYHWPRESLLAGVRALHAVKATRYE